MAFMAYRLGITPSGIPYREGTRAQYTDVKASDLAGGPGRGLDLPTPTLCTVIG